MNLRASNRTDLERIYPKHVCNRWLGHGSAVAERHYLMDTDDEWSRAAQVDDYEPSPAGANSGDICADQGSSTDDRNEKNPVQETHDDSGRGHGYSGSNALREAYQIDLTQNARIENLNPDAVLARLPYA